MIKIKLLIIGAGPFGLSMAAYCKHNKIDHLVVGNSMDFWKSNMPGGVFLRSGTDWHLDPLNIHTIKKYMKINDLKLKKSEPLSLDFYLGYVDWFVKEKGIQPINSIITKLDCLTGSRRRFTVELNNGEKIQAENVLLALGFKYFKNVPEDLSLIFPENRFSHTCDLVELEKLKNKRCLIIGGRQSAFEWAALLSEAGAKSVYVSHRQDTPKFTESDWSWVLPMLDKIVEDPGWFRNLSRKEREEIDKRFWTEGRLKLEPWLAPRLKSDSIKILPETNVTNCRELPNNDLHVEFDSGETLILDYIILATGYKVNMNNIPFLSSGNILEKLELINGFPVLDDYLQTNISGLFVTSMAASQQFGSFFAFTVSANASARMVGRLFSQ
ncbi:MAG: NAD(P)-binding domain-containing protein [Thermodesulfobacteriota bacterium]